MPKFIKVTRRINGVEESVVINLKTIRDVQKSANGMTYISQNGKWDSGATKYRETIGDITKSVEEIYALIQEAQGASDAEKEIDIDLGDAINMAIESGDVDPGDILQMVKDAVK